MWWLMLSCPQGSSSLVVFFIWNRPNVAVFFSCRRLRLSLKGKTYPSSSTVNLPTTTTGSSPLNRKQMHSRSVNGWYVWTVDNSEQLIFTSFYSRMWKTEHNTIQFRYFALDNKGIVSLQEVMHLDSSRKSPRIYPDICATKEKEIPQNKQKAGSLCSLNTHPILAKRHESWISKTTIDCQSRTVLQKV